MTFTSSGLHQLIKRVMSISHVNHIDSIDRAKHRDSSGSKNENFFFPNFSFLDDTVEIINKTMLWWFNCSNIERSSWKMKIEAWIPLLKEKGLEEETLRKYIKIFKVCYKFLTLSLHQFRYKWEFYIEGGKNYSPISVSWDQLSCSFSSNDEVITKKRRSDKSCSWLSLYEGIWSPAPTLFI